MPARLCPQSQAGSNTIYFKASWLTVLPAGFRGLSRQSHKTGFLEPQSLWWYSRSHTALGDFFFIFYRRFRVVMKLCELHFVRSSHSFFLLLLARGIYTVKYLTRSIFKVVCRQYIIYAFARGCSEQFSWTRLHCCALSAVNMNPLCQQ